MLGTRPQEEKGGTARSLIIVLSFVPTITQYAARATSQRPAALTHREHPRFQGLFPTRKGPGNEDAFKLERSPFALQYCVIVGLNSAQIIIQDKVSESSLLSLSNTY